MLQVGNKKMLKITGWAEKWQESLLPEQIKEAALLRQPLPQYR
jgi:hypothetical protein